LGDNRKVDFSHAMIFMTGNVGASEMTALLSPRLGFNAAEQSRQAQSGTLNDKVAGKISRAGTEAARRKFTPEFMNRIDKVVVFHPLGECELRRIVDIELGAVQQRVLTSNRNTPFAFTLTDEAKQFLLDEGTDTRYGARHLKRAIERLVVQPLANLMASEQVHRGDLVSIDHGQGEVATTFRLVREGLAPHELAQAA
jgi:ATP-dependent Clp protease ATP-binding subunit ClpA